MRWKVGVGGVGGVRREELWSTIANNIQIIPFV